MLNNDLFSQTDRLKMEFLPTFGGGLTGYVICRIPRAGSFRYDGLYEALGEFREVIRLPVWEDR